MGLDFLPRTLVGKESELEGVGVAAVVCIVVCSLLLLLKVDGTVDVPVRLRRTIGLYATNPEDISGPTHQSHMTPSQSQKN